MTKITKKPWLLGIRISSTAEWEKLQSVMKDIFGCKHLPVQCFTGVHPYCFALDGDATRPDSDFYFSTINSQAEINNYKLSHIVETSTAANFLEWVEQRKMYEIHDGNEFIQEIERNFIRRHGEKVLTFSKKSEGGEENMALKNKGGYLLADRVEKNATPEEIACFKLGYMDSNLELTREGEKAFTDFLFEKHVKAFGAEAIKKVKEEEEK